MAGLLVSEAKAESQHNGLEWLYLATLDSQEEFHVVHHTILLDKLSTKGVNTDIWLVIKFFLKVKWIVGCSESFPIKQGAIRCGILSTHLYEAFLDDFLSILENKRLGLRIRTVYVGSPACSDDIAFLTKFKDELQLMLNEGKGYSWKHRYEIHSTKTSIVDLDMDCKEIIGMTWSLGENFITVSDSAVHFGINRSGNKKSAIDIEERIFVARRSSYSLMNTGLHGANGLSPEVSYQIYKAYVIPRLLYGLEIIPPTKTRLEKINRYHRETSSRYLGI